MSESKLEENDIVEITDMNHPLFGMLGTVYPPDPINGLTGRHKPWLMLHQLTYRGHADWRDRT